LNNILQAIRQPNSCEVGSCNEWVHNTTRTTLIKEVRFMKRSHQEVETILTDSV